MPRGEIRDLNKSNLLVFCVIAEWVATTGVAGIVLEEVTQQSLKL